VTLARFDSPFPIAISILGDYMKLRDDDRIWLHGEISTEVATAISHEIDKFNPHGARRVARFVREWGLAGTLVMAFLALLAFGAGAVYQATARVERQTVFQTKTEARLDRIEAILKDIQGELAKQSIISHAALPLADFKATLPDLGSAVATAQKQGVKVSPKVAEDLSRKLANTEKTAPAFWPVAGAVISYRSLLLTGGTVETWQLFPQCREPADMDASPNASAQLVDKNGKLTGEKFPISRIGVQDCYIELDGKTASRWDCKHCLIKYSGGPVSLKDVHFENCLFVFTFPSSRQPNPKGQRLGELLLTSDLRNVEIRSL
jgi:hypothetical protein